MSISLSTNTAHTAPSSYTTPHTRNGQAKPSALEKGIDRARQCLLDKQHDDGHWCAELQGDTILESEFILLMTYLGREKDDLCIKAANYLLEQQMSNGGWDNYPGGPADLGTTVKAYFALKLTGHDINASYMKKARDLILSMGGAVGCNSFTKYYLALLGQFPYSNCPAVPPELIFLPKWFYVNLYAMSSWTRTIVVPLSIFYAHKPVRELTDEQGISELFVQPQHTRLWPQEPSHRIFSWHNFFLIVDQIIKFVDPLQSSFPHEEKLSFLQKCWDFVRKPFTAIRTEAVHRAAKWMMERFEDSDGVGAIFPPMVYTVISLRVLGYADDSPEMIWAMKQLTDLAIEENNTVRLQPCFSPVWDTGLTLNALSYAPNKEQEIPIERAVDWLMLKEVRRKGDWSELLPGIEPGGWFFEYHNAFYPDTDDTAMILMALARTEHAHLPHLSNVTGERMPIPAVERALNWLIAMQNTDGGWAAFDRDINHEILEEIPFADHNAMLDPSCPDITARVLEALGQFDHKIGDVNVDRAIRFIERTQDSRGCWIGRWGVNYIYGTWQVLQGLEAVGFDMQQPMIRRAVNWLKQVQQPSGAWGETCRSYDDPALAGQGEPTASQTAWALLGLIAAGEANTHCVQKGIHWLLSTQRADGNWNEDHFTGTGFPKVFYLRYHYYRLYFPLMAMGRYQQAVGRLTTDRTTFSTRRISVDRIREVA